MNGRKASCADLLADQGAHLLFGRKVDRHLWGLAVRLVRMLKLFWVFLLIVSFPVFAEPTDNVSRTEITLHHEDMRLSSELGYQDGPGAFISTQFRYALHDLLDRTGDYPHSTSIEIGSLKWRMHLDNPKPWLDEFTAIRLLRLPPFSDASEWSWSVDVGMRTSREKFCSNCLAGHVRGGIGITEAPIRNFPVEIYLLAEGEMTIAPDAVKSSFQPAIGPRLGFRIWWANNWKALVDTTYRHYFLATSPSHFESHAAVRYYLGWDIAVEARVARLPDGWEYAGGLFAYF